MIINGDGKQLEWAFGSWMAGDEVAKNEIKQGWDAHSDNQKVFGLPSRLIAKTFVFRLIYGGTEYAYAKDPDFAGTSTSVSYWAKVIENFYRKYKGWNHFHISLMQSVTTTGTLTIPTGRTWRFRQMRTKLGTMEFPRPTILNYPIQGGSADMMCLARVNYWKEFKRLKLDGIPLATVHDSLVYDVADKHVKPACELMRDVFERVPQYAKETFGFDYDLPFRVEICIGPNMADLEEVKIN